MEADGWRMVDDGAWHMFRQNRVVTAYRVMMED